MADNKDGRTEVLGDLNFDSLEQQWRQKQMGAPGAPPAPMPPPGTKQDSTVALDVSAADLDSDMSTVSLSAADLANIPQLNMGGATPFRPSPMPGMPGAPLGMPGAPLGMPGMPPGMGGPSSNAPTEALNFKDVEAMMAKNAAPPGGGRVIVGSSDPAIHGSPTAAMPPVSALAPGQVQIKHTGSQPIYKPKKSNTGMIVAVVVVALLLVGGGITAAIMLGGESKGTTTPTPSTSEATTTPEAPKPLSLSESWKAATSLLPPSLDGDPPPDKAHLISASTDQGIKLDNIPLAPSIDAPSGQHDALATALTALPDKGSPLIFAFPQSLSFQQAFPLLATASKNGHPISLGVLASSGALSVVRIDPFSWDGKPAEPPLVKLSLTASKATVVGPKVDAADDTKTEITIDFADEVEMTEKINASLAGIFERNASPPSLHLTVSAAVSIDSLARALQAASSQEGKPLFPKILLAAPVP